MSNAASVELDWVPQPRPDSFGRRLHLMRVEMRLTIEEIVALCNEGMDEPYFNKATWSTWENGAKPRDMAEVVERIHKATKVHRGWLLWGSTSLRKANGTLRGLPTELDHRYSSPTNQPPILSAVTCDPE